jgi:hypothetical protein
MTNTKHNAHHFECPVACVRRIEHMQLQVGFLMALAGVPVRELFNNVDIG